MRIVMSAFTSRGAARRLAALASELRRREHEVVMCGPPEHAELAEAAGLVYVACSCPGLPPLARAPDLVLATDAEEARTCARTVHAPARLVAFTPTSLPEAPVGERPVLAADEEIAPLREDLRGVVAQVPAILAPEGGRLPAPVEAFLAAGEPPVYLGFGSTPARDPARLTRDLVGAVRGLGVRAIVERGWAGIGRDGVRDVLVTDELPHAALFPRCAVVVHHGGAGMTAEACRAGVPQVVVPHLGEQQYWAERVVALGLGRRVLRRHLTAASLHDRLQRILGDQSYRFSAQVMAERLRWRDGVVQAADAVLG